MTQLEAFEQAQETGQIAISENTAKAFAALVKLESVFYDEMLEALTEQYSSKLYDDITGPFADVFAELCNKLRAGIMDYCIFNNGLTKIEFKGL